MREMGCTSGCCDVIEEEKKGGRGRGGAGRTSAPPLSLCVVSPRRPTDQGKVLLLAVAIRKKHNKVS